MIRHIHASVRGLLKLSESEMRRFAPSLSVDGVPLKTEKQVREHLLYEQAQGHEVIPCDECDNFDYIKGCLGHDVPGEGDQVGFNERQE